LGQIAAKTGQQISRMLPQNVANVAAKRHERCRIAVTSTPWNYHFHAMELPPPPHGTTYHPAPSAHFPAACQLLSCRQVGQKKVLSSPPNFPILADFCQEKRKKVTRSDQF
jgi:hypothetical protein